MKVQIKQFSTHQTAKVFAILMAVTSLLFIIPFGLLSMFTATPTDLNGNTLNTISIFPMFLIMPIVQGVFGYIMMRFGMWLYNKLTKHIGGIEFEFEEVNS